MLRLTIICGLLLVHLSLLAQQLPDSSEVLPHGYLLPPGDTATISVNATPQPGVNYVLCQDGVHTDQILSDATADSLVWQVTEPGKYQVVAQQGESEQVVPGQCLVESNAITTLATSCACNSPIIAPATKYLCNQSSVDITLQGAHGANFGFQLYRDGTTVGPSKSSSQCSGVIQWNVSTPGTYTIKYVGGTGTCTVQGKSEIKSGCEPSDPTDPPNPPNPPGGNCGTAASILRPSTNPPTSTNPPPYDLCSDNYTLSASKNRSFYKWCLNSADCSSGSSAYRGGSKSITINESGTYYLTTPDDCGNPRTTSIPITMKPTMSSVDIDLKDNQPTTRCQGAGTTTYFAKGFNVDYFQWDASEIGAVNTVAYTGDSVTVTWSPDFSGSATIKFTAYGCGDSEIIRSRTMTVKKLPTPTISPPGTTTIAWRENGQLLTVSGTGNEDTYQWLRDGLVIPGATQQTYQATLAGEYQVIASNECASVSSATTTVVVENDYNYVIHQQFQASRTQASDLPALSQDQQLEQITYLDGLGRPVQSVVTQASPGQQDMVTHTEYDAFNRPMQQYLPYTSGSTGFYKNNTAIDFYTSPPGGVVQDSEPYAVTDFERSPLDRPQWQGAPGADFQPSTGHAVHYEYRVNDADRYSAQQWTLDINGIPSSTELYADGQLTVVETTDEDDKVSEVYTDKLGRVVLRRVRNEAETLDTYYLYDDIDNLRVVLPPEAATILAPTEEDLNRWAFRYEYDDRRRLSKKKVPGADWQYMLYDKRDRLILSQDGRQRQEQEWVFTHYDALNRPIVEGLYTNGDTYEDMLITVNNYLATNPGNNAEPVGEDEVSAHLHGEPTLELSRYGGQRTITAATSITLSFDQQGGFEVDYASDGPVTIKAPAEGPTPPSNGAFPALTDSEILQLHYYDDYDFDQDGSPDYAYDAGGIPAGAGIVPYGNTRGQPTGTTVRVLDTEQWLTTALFYDDKGRLIQTQSKNHIGGRDKLTTEYSFHGLTLRQWHQQSSDEDWGNQDLTVLTRHAYDESDRLTHVYQTVGTEAEQLLARYEYNALGQLIDKGLHESQGAYCQSVDYRYTIRGWLSSINRNELSSEQAIAGSAINAPSPDLFGQEFAYNTSVSGLTSPSLYNGNISAVSWSSSELAEPKAYVYDYDAVNRLTKADHFTGSSWSVTAAYQVSNIRYDKNGNLERLERNGQDGSAMDNLTYNYVGNQLSSVSDAGDATTGFADGSNVATEYLYDGSGNLSEDLNKDITSIEYNHLNLPEEITFANNNRIRYSYDATGAKLRQTVETGGTLSSETDYVMGRQYQDRALELLMHAEGRTKFSAEGFTQHYDLKDHLGNVRLTFAAEQTLTTFAASMETGGTLAEREEAYFENIEDSRQTLAYHNASPPSSEEPVPNKVATLNAAKGRVKGPAKSLQVHPGDSIHIEVQASYEEHSRKKVQGGSGVLAAVSSVFSPTAAGVEVAGAAEGINEALAGTTLLDRDKTGVPKAYLNYVVMNEERVVIDQGYVPVSEAARIETGKRKKGKQGTEVGADSASHEMLAVDLDIEQEGYLYTYVSNESNWDVDVHFDQMVVAAASSAAQPVIVQSNDYYPFGLQMHQRSYVDGQNRYLYQGKELQPELGWYDFGARMYDPTIGRFNSVDALADHPNQIGMSPYSAMWNNPINLTDPDGNCPICPGLVRLAQRAQPALQRAAQWTQRHGARATRAIQAGFNNAHRAAYYSTTSPQLRAAQNWVATNIQGATSYYYRNAQLVGEGGAFLASAIDPNPAANYSTGAGDELGNAVGASLRKGSGAILDFFGGSKSAYKNGVSIDPQAVSGFKGTIAEFAEQFSGKVGEIVANNPRATFLEEAAGLLESGGTLTVRGQYSNGIFSKILKGKATGLDNFEVVQGATKISSEGFFQSDLKTPIQGTMQEIIFRRK